MNAVHLQFADGRVVSGHGYRVLMQAMFKPGTTTDDIVFFLFGTLVDAQATETDWLLETLRAIKCQEALLFKLVPGGGGSKWTAVRYSNILTENPGVTELPDAGDLYRYKFCTGEETESAGDPPTRPERPPVSEETETLGLGGLVKSVGRALHRWAFGR